MRASSCFWSWAFSASGIFGPTLAGRPTLFELAPGPPWVVPRFAPGFTTGLASIVFSAAARTVEPAGALAPGALSAGAAGGGGFLSGAALAPCASETANAIVSA